MQTPESTAPPDAARPSSLPKRIKWTPGTSATVELSNVGWCQLSRPAQGRTSSRHCNRNRPGTSEWGCGGGFRSAALEIRDFHRIYKPCSAGLSQHRLITASYCRIHFLLAAGPVSSEAWRSKVLSGFSCEAEPWSPRFKSERRWCASRLTSASCLLARRSGCICLPRDAPWLSRMMLYLLNSQDVNAGSPKHLCMLLVMCRF